MTAATTAPVTTAPTLALRDVTKDFATGTRRGDDGTGVGLRGRGRAVGPGPVADLLRDLDRRHVRGAAGLGAGPRGAGRAHPQRLEDARDLLLVQGLLVEELEHEGVEDAVEAVGGDVVTDGVAHRSDAGFRRFHRTIAFDHHRLGHRHGFKRRVTLLDGLDGEFAEAFRLIRGGLIKVLHLASAEMAIEADVITNATAE